MIIRPATYTDIPVIEQLAHDIWWPTYQNVLSGDQISFMLADMYSARALEKEFNEGITFLLAERNEQAVAFAAYSLTEPEQHVFKLHKLYILPSEQGKGTGKNFINHVAGLAREQGGAILELNVNRANPALGFYKKLGFEIYKSVDIPYYQYVLDDYVMRMPLNG